MRGAIDWSWELLSDAEKLALARCAVFRGGFTIEAGEVLLGAEGLLLLESLVDKSLVRRDARFALSETPEYAAEKLVALGAQDDAAKAHVAFYSAFAETRAAELRGDGALDAVAKLRAETDNILEAQRRLRASDPSAAAAIALALDALLAMRGPTSMQRELLESGRVGCGRHRPRAPRSRARRTHAIAPRSRRDASMSVLHSRGRRPEWRRKRSETI